jgi:hypothetical protein
MEGTPRETRIYYRCAARTIVPGSPLLAEHPKNVYLPEAALLDPLNGWISHVFSPAQRETTVRQMLGVAGTAQTDTNRLAAVKRRADDAETRLRRLQQAIEAGASPAALVDAINRAQEEKDIAREELARLPAGAAVGRAEIEAMVDSLEVIGRQVNHASPERLSELYEQVGMEMVYNAKERTVDVTIRPPRRVNAGVRGGT